MALPQPLHEGHQVLGEEDYCSGFMDPFGKWNNGFPCPPLDNDEPVYCCGTDSLKYCCLKPKPLVTPPVSHLALLLGIIFGVAIAVAVVVLVSCFHCSCCLLYKKRQPSTRGTVYQMHCPSNASGVANMYSFSRTPTPSDTPLSASRCSSSPRSRGNMGFGPSIISNSYDLSDLRIRPELLISGNNYTTMGNNSRPGSMALSDRSMSTVSDITVRENVNVIDRNRINLNNLEPPPPYGTPNSTLMTVRAPSVYQQHPPIPRPRTPPSLHAHAESEEVPFTFAAGHDNSGAGSSHLRTFAHVSSPSSVLTPATSRRPSSMQLPESSPASSQFHSTLSHTLNPHQNNQLYGHFHDNFSNPTYALNHPIIRPMTSSLTSSSPRPCSATHIIATHNTTDIDERRLYSATKF